MRATLSRNGRKTTTRVARIRRSTTRHRRPLPPNSPQQAITLRSVMAPRAGLLLTPPERAYSCRDSNPRWGILQWQVIGKKTKPDIIIGVFDRCLKTVEIRRPTKCECGLRPNLETPPCRQDSTLSGETKLQVW